MAFFPSPYIEGNGHLYFSKLVDSPSEVWTDGTAIGRTIHLMQFTGLKDKNGKEIYEGDIVKSEAWSPSTYEVGFREGAFCFYREDSLYANNPEYLFKFEIIGNIYENPELIK